MIVAIKKKKITPGQGPEGNTKMYIKSTMKVF